MRECLRRNKSGKQFGIWRSIDDKDIRDQEIAWDFGDLQIALGYIEDIQIYTHE